MSSLLMNFWPFKSFFQYVFQRSFGKFLKNDIDLKLYDFSKKKITFKNLDLNTQKINEALKDSPFKVVSCSIGKLVLVNPSLNILTQKLNVEVSNIDLILMPIFSEGHANKERTYSESSNDDSAENEAPGNDPQKSEEFNILNNLVNKILSNLEVMVSSVAIRVLTKEISEDLAAIPTFLLRVNQIEYKREKEIDLEGKQLSDTQVILDGKTLEISEVSLHLMDSTHLYPDEFHPKHPQLQKLRFPFEYPLINHPNTLLLIKPIVSSKDKQHHQTSALNVKLEFPPNSKVNTLTVGIQVPNIEAIVSLGQLGAIRDFAHDLEVHQSLLESQSLAFSDLALLDPLTKPKIDEDVLSFYGNIIKTNQQYKNKDLFQSQAALALQKTKRTNAEFKKTANRSKPKDGVLKKDKLIYKFLQKTQDKREFQKLKEDLKQSMMSQSQDSASLLESQSLISSMSERTKNTDLQVKMQLQLNKISVCMICSESSLQYDKLFDSISCSLQGNPQLGAFMGTQSIDESLLRRQDHLIGDNYYNLEVRSVTLCMNQKKIKFRPQKSSNPFQKSSSIKGKETRLQCSVKQLQVNRYDLVENPLPHHQNFSGGNNDQSSAQYESFSSNSLMFHSAMEFYQLEESKGMSQSHGKRPGTGHAVDQSSTSHESSQQHHPLQILTSVFKLNPCKQHFCKTSIVDVMKLTGPDQGVCDLNLVLKDGVNERILKGHLDVGIINIGIGWNDTIVMLALLRQTKPKPKPLHLSKQSETIPLEKKVLTTRIESFEIKLQGIRLEIANFTIDGLHLLDLTIQNKPVEQLMVQTCLCQSTAIYIQSIIVLEAAAPTIQVTNVVDLHLLSLDLNVFTDNIQLPVISLSDIHININNKVTSGSGAGVSSDQLKERKPFIIFEDEEQESDDSEEQPSPKQQQEAKLQPKTLIKVGIKGSHIEVDLKHLTPLTKLAIDIEQRLKLLSLLVDVSKCHVLQKKSALQLSPSKLDQVKHPFNEMMAKSLDDQKYSHQTSKADQSAKHLIQLDLQGEDLQVLITDTTVPPELNESSLFHANTHNRLLKLRAKNVGLSFDLIDKAMQEQFKVRVKVEDAFLLDYTQKICQFHPHLLKQSDQLLLIPTSINSHIGHPSSSFGDELNTSAPFVLIYRQQGLDSPHHQCQAVDVQLDVEVLKRNLFGDILSVGRFQQLFEDLPEDSNKALQLFEDVSQLKKNPVKISIDSLMQGLVFRLSFQLDLFKKIKSYSKQFKVLIKQNRVPIQVVQQPSKDKVQFSLTLLDIAFDYSPVLSPDIYDKLYEGSLQHPTGDSSIGEELLYKTPLRAIFYMGDIKLSISERVQSSEKLNEHSIVAKNIWVSVLDNNVFNEQMNPTLLIDTSQSLDIKGGSSLLDQLGFVQLSTIDLLELSHLKVQESADITSSSTQGDQQEEEKGEDEEDLYETSYGLNTMIKKSTRIVSERQHITAVASKFNLYLAKDSVVAIKRLGKVIDSVIDDINMQSSKKANKKSKSRKKQNDVTQDLEEGSGDDLQRILEQFLFMDYDQQEGKVTVNDFESSQASAMNQEEGKFASSSRSDITMLRSQSLEELQRDDEQFFSLNSWEPQSVNSDFQKLDLAQLVIQDYLPLLSTQLISQNRHRQCHMLPKELDGLLSKMKMHLEIQQIDLKVFEGMDFDFNKAPKTNYQSEFSLSSSQQSENSQYQKQKQGELFSFDEDYLAQKPQNQATVIVKKVPISKRPRHTGRGNFFQIYLRNQIFTFNELIDDTKDDGSINRICFSIQQLMIRETLSKEGGQPRELIQLPFAYQFDNQIQVTASRDIYEQYEELGLKVKLQPFKLMLNQAVITFFQKLLELDLKPQNRQPKEESALRQPKYQSQRSQSASMSDTIVPPKKPIFINELKICPLQAILSYNSKSLNLLDLTNGKKVEFLNIFNIRDLKLNVKQYDLQQRILLESALKHLVEFYKEDMVKNQKVSIVKAIGPLRSFANLSGAMYGLLKRPYLRYQQDKGIVKGMGEGFYGLYKAVSDEASYLTSQVTGKETRRKGNL